MADDSRVLDFSTVALKGTEEDAFTLGRFRTKTRRGPPPPENDNRPKSIIEL